MSGYILDPRPPASITGWRSIFTAHGCFHVGVAYGRGTMELEQTTVPGFGNEVLLTFGLLVATGLTLGILWNVFGSSERDQRVHPQQVSTCSHTLHFMCCMKMHVTSVNNIVCIIVHAHNTCIVHVNIHYMCILYITIHYMYTYYTCVFPLYYITHAIHVFLCIVHYNTLHVYILYMHIPII